MSELPDYLAEAWGVRDRAGRGPKPALSLERIVTAAIAVADAEGIGAVSMSRVAKELNTGAMSLYRYVTAKSELLELMVDQAVGPPPPAGPGETWRDGISRWAWGLLTALRARPWVLHIPITGPPATPNQLTWLENGLRALDDTGLPPAQRLSVMLWVSGFVWNNALLNLNISEHKADNAIMPVYARVLTTLITPDRFPALTAVLTSGTLNVDDHPDHEFTFGLARTLDGIEALIRAPGGRPTG